MDSCLLERSEWLRDLVCDWSCFYGASMHRLVLPSAFKALRGFWQSVSKERYWSLRILAWSYAGLFWKLFVSERFGVSWSETLVYVVFCSRFSLSASCHGRFPPSLEADTVVQQRWWVLSRLPVFFCNSYWWKADLRLEVTAVERLLFCSTYSWQPFARIGPTGLVARIGSLATFPCIGIEMQCTMKLLLYRLFYYCIVLLRGLVWQVVIGCVLVAFWCNGSILSWIVFAWPVLWCPRCQLIEEIRLLP